MSNGGYRDYFNVLGVERSADGDSIKKAFRELARKYHPDVNPQNPGAEAKFKEITEAYEVLSDPEKKRRYEQYGQYWNQSSSQGMSGFDVDFSGYNNFDDFINELLGKFVSPRRAAGFSQEVGSQSINARNQLNLDAEVIVKISFSEAFNGTERTLSVNDERVQVKIPPGIKSGSRLRLKAKGNIQPGIGRRGDLYLLIQVSSHEIWRLEGDHLKAALPLSLDEIVLGSVITAITPDGEAEVNIPAGTLPGTNLRLKGKGWPSNNSRGDLIFIVQLKFPNEWSIEELQHLHDLKRIRCKNPRESWMDSARI